MRLRRVFGNLSLGLAHKSDCVDEQVSIFRVPDNFLIFISPMQISFPVFLPSIMRQPDSYTPRILGQFRIMLWNLLLNPTTKSFFVCSEERMRCKVLWIGPLENIVVTSVQSIISRLWSLPILLLNPLTETRYPLLLFRILNWGHELDTLVGISILHATFRSRNNSRHIFTFVDASDPTGLQ